MAWSKHRRRFRLIVVLFSLFVATAFLANLFSAPAPLAPAPAANVPFPMPLELEGVDLNRQSDADVAAKNAACLQCHQDVRDPHFKATVHLGCTDCHGGGLEGKAVCPPDVPGPSHGCPAAPPAHNPGAWRSSANPA